MKRVRKQTVKRMIRKQGYAEVFILPCKANPHSPWFGGDNPHFLRFDSLENFEEVVTGMTIYQCCWELGYYPAYYIKEE